MIKKQFYNFTLVAFAISLLFSWQSTRTVHAEDEQFEWVVQPEWNFIAPFSDGYAALRDFSSIYYQIDNYGFVDRFGKVRMLPDGWYPDRFQDGVAYIRVNKYDGSTYYGTDIKYVRINKDFEVIDEYGLDYEYWQRPQEKDQTDEYSIVTGKMYPDDRYPGYYVVDQAGTPIIRLYDPDSYSSNKEYALSEDNSVIYIRDGHINSYNLLVKALKFGKDPAILNDVYFSLGDGFENYSPNALIAYKCIKEDDGSYETKYGAFDSDFNLIVPFEYDALGKAYNEIGIESGIINAKRDGKWGYIDLSNNVVVDFQFDDAYSFSEGRGCVKINGYYGVIRLTNDGELYSPSKTQVDVAYTAKVNINGKEEYAYKIGEHIYLPIELLKNYGFDIDKSYAGKRIDITRRRVKTNTTSLVPFNEQESYTVYESEAYVYIDRFLFPSSLIEDTTAVEFDSLSKYGMIWENNGMKHIAFNFPYLPNEGITWEFVENIDDFLDKKEPSQETVKKETEYPLLKIEGRIHEGSGNFSSWGTVKYYDENDNLVLDDNWSDARLFSNGTALVMKGGTLQRGGIYNGKWGLIDTTGNYLVECIWDFADKTEDGYITYSINSESDGESRPYSWVADPKGNDLTADEYRQFRLDRYGMYYFVEENGLKGVVDVDDNVVLPFIFSMHAVSWSTIRPGNYSKEGCLKVSREKTGSDYIKFINIPVLSGGVFINGEKVEFDTPPLLINNRTMIPARAVFEKMGCTVEWIEDISTVVITCGDMRVEVKQGTNFIIKNGEYSYSDTAAINYNNRIYIPLRVVLEALGCDVDYDNATGNVKINETI